MEDLAIAEMRRQSSAVVSSFHHSLDWPSAGKIDVCASRIDCDTSPVGAAQKNTRDQWVTSISFSLHGSDKPSIVAAGSGLSVVHVRRTQIWEPT